MWRKNGIVRKLKHGCHSITVAYGSVHLTRKLGPRDLEGRPCMSVLLGGWMCSPAPRLWLVPQLAPSLWPNKVPSLAYQTIEIGLFFFLPPTVYNRTQVRPSRPRGSPSQVPSLSRVCFNWGAG